ncbi:chromosomal replication initiator protein DnaA [Candidatus Gracilibacteria bacterium]|nr:chromosomal replication initiator protein DnaA [Candidatus Gracilibacteria bacterium]
MMDSLNKFYPQVIHLDLVINQNEIQQEQVKQQVLANLESPEEAPQSSNTSKKFKTSYLPGSNLNNLNPKYTFDTFVKTSNTELVHNVTKAVSEKPGSAYNPVFIYGGVGLGKTHLMQAVGHKALENFPNLNIKYIPCETFVSQFQIAIRSRTMDKFKEHYRSIELLLIDDIQFLSGKESTQEEFFHTFNLLHQDNKQIIITSDKAPNQIAGIEERLISRFSMGMVVDIDTPTVEDRIAILNDKTARMQLNLPDHQILAIAERINTNVRDLEGVLNKIQAKMTFSLKNNISDNELQNILEVNDPGSSVKIEYLNNPSGIRTQKILNTVCKYFGYSQDQILGTGRQKDVSLARQIVMWLFKYELEMSYPAIGKVFGGRNHTTVMHAINKVDSLTKKDTKLKQKINHIKSTSKKD